jgi:WD-40 repeat-containing protein
MSGVKVTKCYTLTGHRDAVYTLQPSGASNLFFSGAGDGMVVLWNLEDPEIGQLIAKLPNSVYALYYDNRSDLLIAGHNYEGIHFLDWRNKRKPVRYN